jgi:lysozyme family protein
MEYSSAFIECWRRVVLIYESLRWSNTPGDAGGETFAGISRVAWPNLPLWKLVDALPNKERYITAPGDGIYEMVQDFYYNEFFLKCGCDKMPVIAAIDMFDMAVNIGSKRAVKYLQRILNMMNNCGRRWSDLSETGNFGPMTTDALQKFLASRWIASIGEIESGHLLMTMLNHMQAYHYIDILETKNDQEKFALSWFSRT